MFPQSRIDLYWNILVLLLQHSKLSRLPLTLWFSVDYFFHPPTLLSVTEDGMSITLAEEPQQLLIGTPTMDEEVLKARTRGKLGFLRPRLIDLFAGAGGMTLGFSPLMGHSFETVWANDCNTYAVETYNANFGRHCVSGDIVDLLSDPAITIPQAEVVIGGPPCQGFSLLNKLRSDDHRKQL